MCVANIYERATESVTIMLLKFSYIVTYESYKIYTSSIGPPYNINAIPSPSPICSRKPDRCYPAVVSFHDFSGTEDKVCDKRKIVHFYIHSKLSVVTVYTPLSKLSDFCEHDLTISTYGRVLHTENAYRSNRFNTPFRAYN